MSRLRYYRLDAHHRPVPVTLMQWVKAFEDMQTRRVALTEFECGVAVSTVFLGLDHRFMGDGPPLLFETMVFELTMDQGDSMQQRYSSWDDAVTGHNAAVRRVKQLLEKAGLPIKEHSQ